MPITYSIDIPTALITTRCFGHVTLAEVKQQVLPGGCPPCLVPAHEDGRARLRGTIALVLQKHFGVFD